MRSNPVLPDPRVEKVGNTLIQAGHSVIVLAWNRSRERQNKYGSLKVSNGLLPIRWFNIPATYSSGLRNLPRLILFQMRILGWLIKHRHNYDAIHACDFDTVIPAWLCAKIYHKKYIYDIFDYYVDAFKIPNIFKTVIEKIDILMINSADFVIIANESRKQQIGKSHPKKLMVIHNSPDFNFNEIHEVEYTEKLRFVYVGILNKDRFLVEILEVIQEHKEWELHIGGYGPYEQLIKEKAEKYKNIIYYGRLPYRKVIEIEQNSHILFAIYNPLVPNHKYSSPNKLYEAMMLGKPIIVAQDTGLDKLVLEHNLGKSIDYTKESFIKAVNEIVSEREIWESQKEKSQMLYAHNFSWDIMAHRLIYIYENL